MEKNDIPVWMADLKREDFEFIRQFILSSGSLKDLASHYDVSYPTIRLRLDRLIQAVSAEKREEDKYVSLIKDLAFEGEISFDTAKKLITSYREERR